MLLLAPFALWIVLLIVLPQLGMLAISLREKVAPRLLQLRPRATTSISSASRSTGTRCCARLDVVLVTVLALLIGFPIAYYIAKIAGNRSRARCS